jgi:hypothetical protein
MALVKYNNNSISAVTSTGLATGSLVPIKTLTASSSATLSFVHGTDGVVLDSTYPIYKFSVINFHPSTHNGRLEINFSTDSGSNYNVTKTTTWVQYFHDEADTATALQYDTGGDLAQSTSNQRLNENVGNDSDECAVTDLTFFNPSSTTFVKHFIFKSASYFSGNYSNNWLGAGYCNTTSVIDAVRFSVNTGTFDGKIKLYGIKDS